MQEKTAELSAGFDAHQLTAIAEFLTRGTDFACRRAALLRSQTLTAGGHARAAARTVAPAAEE